MQPIWGLDITRASCVRLSAQTHGSDLHPPASLRREGDDDGRSKHAMSAVAKKASAAFCSCTETALRRSARGHQSLPQPGVRLPNQCWQHRHARLNMDSSADGLLRRCAIPIRGGLAGNGGKCQPLLSRSSTPEYCQRDLLRGRIQPAGATPQSRHHRRQPEVLPDDDDEQKVECGSGARGSADRIFAYR
jgi:hypothetical protein